MQINSFIQGMMNIGMPAQGQSGQGTQTEDMASQFEEMLVDRSHQSRQEKTDAPKKEAKPAEKPQQAQDSSKEEVTEEGMEVAASLVTSQPVVLFDVVDLTAAEPAAPLEGLQEFTPAVVELAAPKIEDQWSIDDGQPLVEAPVVEEGFTQEVQQVPDVEAQPESQQAEVDVKPQEQPVEQVKAAQPEAAQGEAPEEVEVKDVEIEAEPVFHKETATPVKVADNYEPVAPEEPQAPQQMADRLMQMIDQGDSRVQIQLNPENLGQMTIEITRLQDGALHIVLGAVSQKATALLQENSANLHSLLAASNQGEVRIEVQQQEPQQPMQQFMNPDEQGKQQPQQQQKPKEQAKAEDFVQQMRLGLVEKDEE